CGERGSPASRQTASEEGGDREDSAALVSKAAWLPLLEEWRAVSAPRSGSDKLTFRLCLRAASDCGRRLVHAWSPVGCGDGVGVCVGGWDRDGVGAATGEWAGRDLHAAAGDQSGAAAAFDGVARTGRGWAAAGGCQHPAVRARRRFVHLQL